jgi:pyridoxine 5-phosphate synthase
MNRSKLSVNINKYALLRNSRGHDAPNLLAAADACIAAGAHGVTIHPRLDQRHVRFDDIVPLAEHLRANHPTIELNIECEASEAILARVRDVVPDQCTLVPVTPGEVTSDHGYRFPGDGEALTPIVASLKALGIRVSIFMDPDPAPMAVAAETGIDRVEIYTGPYAWAWGTEHQDAETRKVFAAAAAARAAGLGVNAGHDLDRFNLEGLRGLEGLDEVSIGHAQICRALEVGTTRSVKELLAALGW